MTKLRLEYLLNQYLADMLTPVEREEWQVILGDNRFRAWLDELIDDRYDQLVEDELVSLSHQKADEIFAAIVQQKPKPVRKTLSDFYYKFAAAAAILIVLSAAAYFLSDHLSRQSLSVQNKQEAISPVNHGVVLTLSGSKQINLALKHTGHIATIGNANINQKDSLLSYASPGEPVKDNELHTLTNNSAHTFRLILADGTEATLDVASSLTYPGSFSGSKRRVSMAGQVYFKVKHNARQPFSVTVANLIIEDIGTQFNVEAFRENALATTTLVEGSVKVKHDTSELKGILLIPGEQAISSGSHLKVVSANIEETTAWLQGKIVFHHETLENIMQRVARIYDVKVIWQDNELRKLSFGGSVSRTKKLSTVLNFFRQAGNVDFTVEGRIVKIFKKKTNN